MNLAERFGLQLAALLIAVALWFQVNGQGQGSLGVDAQLQVVGLPEGMVIINDLPDRVRVTVRGLRSRLRELRDEDVVAVLDASDIERPGVLERAIQPEAIRLPAGIRVERIQPDRLQLQIDRFVRRAVPVVARIELPEGWRADKVHVVPDHVFLEGPEVWLDALKEVATEPVRPELKAGDFDVSVGVESPSGKGIRLVEANLRVRVQGKLGPVQEQTKALEGGGE